MTYEYVDWSAIAMADYIYPEFRNLNDRSVFLRVPKPYWVYPFEKTKEAVVSLMKKKGFIAAGLSKTVPAEFFEVVSSEGEIMNGVIDTI